MNYLRLLVATLFSLAMFWSSTPVVFAVGDGCATSDSLSATQRTALTNLLEANSGSTAADMSCQDLSADVSATVRTQRCISGACTGGRNRMCCLPSTGASGGREPGTAEGEADESGGGILRLELPTCIESGNCGLDDILQTGVNFANFLFGISGAIFLAIFVYAGFKYIFFASNANEAGSAKSMIVNATIGIIIMFGASALVTTIYNSIRVGGTAGDEQCAALYENHSCQALTANWSDEAARNEEIRSRRCQPGLCGEDNRLVCCPNR